MATYEQRDWLPHEKPTFPGSPSTPIQPLNRQICFFLVGILVTLTGGMGNALVYVNTNNLMGVMKATSIEIAWLPAAYIMTNITSNILLIKIRQQYGLRFYVEAFMLLYVLITFAHLFTNSYESAIAVRAAHGFVSAVLNTLGVLYLIQAFPAKHRIKALVISIGVTQLSTPIARAMSFELLAIDEWRGMYFFEFGLALLSFAGVLWLKLPPGDRFKVFEKWDFVTFFLLAPGMALLTAVLSLGRLVWWFDAQWIGICSALAVVLITAAWIVEHNRTNPLINTRWLSSGKMIRLALSVLLIRIVLSEQTTGIVGFFQLFNLNNDQLQSLYIVVLIGSLLGIVVGALTINVKNLMMPFVLSALLMGTGALMDAQATNLSRPENMYISQFLLAFGCTYFVGPSMIMGIGDVLANPQRFVSFVVMFGISHNLGGILGSSILGTIETWREKFHANYLAEHMTLTDPLVAARINQQMAAYAHTITDPVQLQAVGLQTLGQVITREANILAYTDTFMLFAVIAYGTALWMIMLMIKHAIETKN